MAVGIQNKVAIVTGGSSGIGLETVKLLLSQGAKVAWCGRNVQRLEQSYEMVCEQYPEEQCLIWPCDVLDKKQVHEFIEQLIERCGAIDMQMNKAGQGRGCDSKNTTEEQWGGKVNIKYFK